MRYLDVCAGISASSVAWKPLGWEAAAYSEIEAAPRAILEHRQGALPVGWDHRHTPGSNTTPLFGDFTQIEAHHVGPIDLLVGGTPCQDFSVAGLRAGLDGDRGNLSLEFLRLADRARPRWLVWENVPGVLSIDGGRAFGAILGGMGELGYGFAYRILDAQHFGVPQRRRRVFVVGYLGGHRRAGAVLFERHGLSGHPAPRRQEREGFAGRVARSLAIRGRDGAPHAELGDELANAILTPSDGIGVQEGLAYTLEARAEVQAIAFNSREDCCSSETHFGSLGSSSPQAAAVALMENQRGEPGQGYAAAVVGSAVRRLTPRECERLQGFPDDYTLVPNRGKPMADGPRYKALGNSMAVPVMRWIGERIAAVEAITFQEQAA